MAEERKEKRKEIVLVVFVLWYSEWREGVGYFTLQINTNGKSAMFFSATVGMGPKEVNHRLSCHSQFKKIKKLSHKTYSLSFNKHPILHILFTFFTDMLSNHIFYIQMLESVEFLNFTSSCLNWFKELIGPTRPKIHWVITEVHNSTFHPLRSCYWGAKLVIIVGRLQYFVFEVHAILVWAIIVCVWSTKYFCNK